MWNKNKSNVFTINAGEIRTLLPMSRKAEIRSWLRGYKWLNIVGSENHRRAWVGRVPKDHWVPATPWLFISFEGQDLSSWTFKTSPFATEADLGNFSPVCADLSCSLLRWPKVKPGELFCRLTEPKLCQGWQISPSDHEDPLSQVTADMICLAQAAGLGETFWHSQAPGIIH